MALLAVIDQLNEEYQPKFGEHGGDFNAWGNRAALGAEVQFGRSSAERLMTTIPTHKRGFLGLRGGRLRTLEEAAFLLRSELDQWLETQPWAHLA